MGLFLDRPTNLKISRIHNSQLGAVPRSCEYESHDSSSDSYSQLGAVLSCEYNIILGKHAKKRIKSLFDSGFVESSAISVNL